MKFYVTIFLLLVTCVSIAQVPCPSYVQTSSNDKCAMLEWDETPSQFPPTVSINSHNYSLFSSNSNPATYVKEGTNGNGCNNYINFSGDMIADNTICTYANGILAGSSALPVSLQNFNGTLKNGNAVIEWATASEQNNRGFSVEKSLDGIQWYEIGWLAGAGTTTVAQFYSFTDSRLVAGNNYYRLKQFDYDGAFHYSPVINVANKTADDLQIKVSPNPVHGFFILSFPEEDVAAEISIYNLLGARVFQTSGFEQRIDVSNLESGTYALVVATQKKTHVETLIIQK